MENYTIIHKVCGKEAELSFYTDDDWQWIDEEEINMPVNRLLITCKTCDLTDVVEPHDP